MTDLTQTQRELIQAALDGKQMQVYRSDGHWHECSTGRIAIQWLIDGYEVRIAPQPRVLHYVQLESGSLIVHSEENIARALATSEPRHKYARIEIDEAGNITGKVEQ